MLRPVSLESVCLMDQHSSVRFLDLMGLNATRIRQGLEAMLRADAIPCPTAIPTLGSVIWTQTDSETGHSEIDDAIVQGLSEIPLASVKELARWLCCALTTVPHHFVSKHLQWVPHGLPTADRIVLVEESNRLFQFIKLVRQYCSILPVT
jgi:hypothetical protein